MSDVNEFDAHAAVARPQSMQARAEDRVEAPSIQTSAAERRSARRRRPAGEGARRSDRAARAQVDVAAADNLHWARPRIQCLPGPSSRVNSPRSAQADLELFDVDAMDHGRTSFNSVAKCPRQAAPRLGRSTAVDAAERIGRVVAGPGVETSDWPRRPRACAAPRVAGTRWRSARPGAIGSRVRPPNHGWPASGGGQGTGFEPATSKVSTWCSSH